MKALILALVASGSMALGQNDPFEKRCAELASSPHDSGRTGSGVRIEQIDVGQALGQCGEAVKRRPSNARNHFHLGRVLEAAARLPEARAEYAIAEQAGFPPAMYNLGVLYEFGRGVAKDFPRAMQHFQKAAAAGNPDGYGAIARLFVKSTPPNYAEAARWNQRGVDAGSAEAGAGLGWQHQFGQGVARNPVRAMELYAQAARGGSPHGMYLMGVLYLLGEGVAANDAQAARWFQQAAERGHVEAQARLGDMLLHGRGAQKDDRQAFHWLMKAGQAGNANAQFWVGAMYDGGQGMPKDDGAAVQWYRRAAEQNDPDAMAQLGLHLRTGKGVARDPVAAMQWFRKAADVGSAEALTEIGWSYLWGLGVATDERAAVAWFSKAVQRGSGVAMLQLGFLCEQGWGVSRDRERARSLYLQASRSPHPEVARASQWYLSGLTPSATRKRESDAGAVVGGVVVLATAIALVDLLFSGPSRPRSSPQATNSGGGSSSGPQDQQILRDHIQAEQSAREAAATQRQQERDNYYHTQRCGFNARANCF
jgi:TPR repeat protein